MHLKIRINKNFKKPKRILENPYVLAEEVELFLVKGTLVEVDFLPVDESAKAAESKPSKARWKDIPFKLEDLFAVPPPNTELGLVAFAQEDCKIENILYLV